MVRLSKKARLIHADEHQQSITFSDLLPLSTLLALAQQLVSLYCILSSSSSSSSPTAASSIPLPSIPDTFHAVANGMLCRKIKLKQRYCAISVLRKDPAEALTEVLGIMLEGNAWRVWLSLATHIRMRHLEHLQLRNQRQVYKASTKEIYLLARWMVVPRGALPA